MGCSSSNPKPISNAPPPPKTKQNVKTPLTKKEIETRIDAPGESQRLKIGKIDYCYAWVSQRGYYPDAPNKENQDAYAILPKLENVKDGAFFGVFDGHGKEGHLCARYAKSKLPAGINYFISNMSEETPPDDVKVELLAAHVGINQLLHDDTSIDDSLSGTTCISVLFLGRRLYVSNVGDSRAIVVSLDGDKYVAKPLSSDQTPYRQDERERCKKYGARILSMDQLEGLEPVHENWGSLSLGEEIDEGGDPPRVWSPSGPFPGTAFTRSFGDRYAKQLGVNAEPEILFREIQPNDKYLIIASDGVWEFLTNQMVADMVSRISDPLEACRAVVAQSYELWLQYEVRTDDITIIVMQIDGNQSLKYTGRLSISGDASSDDIALMITETTNKPVRREMSREKLKIVRSSSNPTMKRLESLKNAPKVPKTDEERARILHALRDNFLFRHLGDAKIDSLIDLMQRVEVSKGDWVIRQGAEGDRFYIVDSGVYEVRVKSSDPVLNEQGGTVVHVYESGTNHHPSFGELSLMYGKPRAASIIAMTNGVLWGLDRFIFIRKVLRAQTVRGDIMRSLHSIEKLKSLTVVQLQRIMDLMKEESFLPGEVLLRQGEMTNKFAIIIEGHCQVIRRLSTGEEMEEDVLDCADFFGEGALLAPLPSEITIIASDHVTLFQVEHEEIVDEFGDLESTMAMNITQKQQHHRQSLGSAPATFSALQLCGCVSSDRFGSLVLAQYNARSPNLCLKTFFLDSKEILVLKHDIMNMVDTSHALKTLRESSDHFPALLASYRDNNAYHLLFAAPIVASLESLLVQGNDRIRHLDFIAAAVISALEDLHKAGIVYRSIQPEGIHLDASGKVVLLEYSSSKVDGVGKQTFTLCGAPDYMAPEQVSQQGHNESVDFWALGVLLYELFTGENPFIPSGNVTELGIFLKISSFGKPQFPRLSLTEMPDSLADLISHLVVTDPCARLGMGSGGIESLKRHPFFQNVSFDADYFLNPSPLKEWAEEVQSDLMEEGIPADLIEQWNRGEESHNNWINDFLVQD